MHIKIENTTSQIISSESILRNDTIRARDMVESGYIKLAGYLYKIYHDKTYATWGFNSFEEYVDKELSIGYRKSLYLIDFESKSLLFNIDPARFEKIGWTKARELLRILDYNNVEEWLHLAERVTCKELTVLIKEAKNAKFQNRGSTALPELDVENHPTREIKQRGPSITDTTSKTSIVFKVAAIEKAVVKEALEESRKLLDTEDTSLALANICQDWLEVKGVVPQHVPLEDRIKLLEQTYNVKLKVVNNSSVIEENWDATNELAPEIDDDEDELFS